MTCGMRTGEKVIQETSFLENYEFFSDFEKVGEGMPLDVLDI